ncbi:MAG: 4-hydroxythreonine-4-phosphate dehydrogenase PdxA [Verrucomicrobia bacterium]|nr:4-hydroxythreonine-4-phosphate dehydrogenase PdxA [Verrucomicrobiota bacterium]
MRIGITCGDPAGIGPEIALAASMAEAREPGLHFVLIGDHVQLLRIAQLRSPAELPDAISFEPDPSNQGSPGQWTRSSASSCAAMRWLEHGARLCMAGKLDALVTGPVSKEGIIDAGWTTFRGQTEHLTALAGASDTVMMLLGDDDRGRWIRVSLATVHIPIRAVPDALTADAVELAIRRSSEACALLGLARARIGVCGLNPHAGEGGKIGDEEIRIVRPAVEACRARGLDVEGPLAADTLFHQAIRGDFDAVVAMYHDQGLAPMKLAAFDNGVNWTLGLPFIRTSPDHGTAFDIAGRGKADPSSMRAAIRLAVRLARKRDTCAG